MKGPTMHQRIRLCTAAGLALSLAAAVIAYGQRGESSKPERVNLSTKHVSYAVGYDIGRKYKQLGVEVNPNQLAAGLRASLTDAEPRMSEKQIDRTLQAFRRKLSKQRKQNEQTQAKEQIKAGEQFLRQNKQKEDVQVTDSGLQYKVMKPGSGQSPDANDRVTVHYTGKLLSGEVFGSSRKRGQPATFGVNEVIPGWTEALQLMKPGAKYKLWIPSDLAYGQQGAGKIKPGSTLIFTVELLKVSRND
jgi:FKBP-type peptidyl-prolyl cis-trans isomerase